MKKILPFAILLLALLSACSVKLVTPTQADVDRVSPKFQGYTLSDLNEGKSLFEQTCSRCHHLKNPTSRGEDSWNTIVPKMINRLNKKEGKEVINDTQRESIRKYLVTMSGAPK